MPRSDRIFIAGCLTIALLLAALSFHQPIPLPVGDPEAAIVFEDDQLHGPIVEGPRSPKWPAVRAAYLKKHPNCEFLGCKDTNPEVHHVKPFHTHPELELDPKNLISLCREGDNHHLYVGHDGNFSECNPDVRACCQIGAYSAKGWKRWQAHKKDMKNFAPR